MSYRSLNILKRQGNILKIQGIRKGGVSDSSPNRNSLLHYN